MCEGVVYLSKMPRLQKNTQLPAAKLTITNRHYFFKESRPKHATLNIKSYFPFQGNRFCQQIDSKEPIRFVLWTTISVPIKNIQLLRFLKFGILNSYDFRTKGILDWKRY